MLKVVTTPPCPDPRQKESCERNHGNAFGVSITVAVTRTVKQAVLYDCRFRKKLNKKITLKNNCHFTRSIRKMRR